MKIAFVDKFRRKTPQAVEFRRARLTRKGGDSWLLMVAFGLIALFLGMVGGLGSPVILLVIGSAIFSLMLLFLVNFYTLFWILAIVTFIVQGSAVYFLGINSATWIAVGMAIMFFFRIVLELALRSIPAADLKPSGVRGTAVIVTATLFIVCFLASIVLNHLPVAQILAAGKAALPMYGLLFSLFWIRWDEAVLLKFWKFAIWIMILEVPVVLLQHFAYGSNGKFDSVVGTFGGTPGSGGNSAFLVLFTILAITYATARWDKGLMSMRMVVAIFMCGFAIILLGEVKAAFIWLPLSMFWVLRRRILKNVLGFLAFAIFISMFMLVTYEVYNALYWNNAVDKVNSLSGKFQQGGGYFFDPNNVDYRTGEISRGASVAIWFRDLNATMPKRLLGFGPGASRPAGLVGTAGVVAKRYAPLHLNASALAILLWDTGILGAIAFTGILLSATGTVFLYLRRPQENLERTVIMETSFPILLIFISLIIYNRAVMEEPTTELLLMFCLGNIVQFCRFNSILESMRPNEATNGNVKKDELLAFS